MVLLPVEGALHKVQRLVSPEAEETTEHEGQAEVLDPDPCSYRNDPEGDHELAASGVKPEHLGSSPEGLDKLVGRKDTDDQRQRIGGRVHVRMRRWAIFKTVSASQSAEMIERRQEEEHLPDEHKSVRPDRR